MSRAAARPGHGLPKRIAPRLCVIGREACNPMIDNFYRRALLFTLFAWRLGAEEWPMYLFDPSHSSFNVSESKIDKRNVKSLGPRWTAKLSAPVAAAPTISGGAAYVGSWDGNFYAIDVTSGAPIWRSFVGMAAEPEAPWCMPAVGVSSQAVVGGSVVYVGGG